MNQCFPRRWIDLNWYSRLSSTQACICVTCAPLVDPGRRVPELMQRLLAVNVELSRRLAQPRWRFMLLKLSLGYQIGLRLSFDG